MYAETGLKAWGTAWRPSSACAALLVDNLGKVSLGLGKAKVGFGWADNSLTCDSEGNCMLKDELLTIKQQIEAEFLKETGGKSIKEAVADDISEGFAEQVAEQKENSIRERVEEELSGAAPTDIAEAVQAEIMEETGGLSIKDAVAAEFAKMFE